MIKFSSENVHIRMISGVLFIYFARSLHYIDQNDSKYINNVPEDSFFSNKFQFFLLRTKFFIEQ